MKFKFTILKSIEKDDMGFANTDVMVGDYTPPEGSEWEIDCVKELSIGHLFDAYGHAGWDMLCDMTEQLAKQIKDKYIVVAVDENNEKKILVPNRYGFIYMRYSPQLRETDYLPYEGDNLMICSMTQGMAEGTLQLAKSWLKPKAPRKRIFRIEKL